MVKGEKNLSYYIIYNRIYHSIKIHFLNKAIIPTHHISHIKHINQMSDEATHYEKLQAQDEGVLDHLASQMALPLFLFALL